jgi:hypothetical protein
MYHLLNFAPGGFDVTPTDDALNRYKRLTEDQGQMTATLKGAFDRKEIPKMDSAAILSCVPSNHQVSRAFECAINLSYNANAPATHSLSIPTASTKLIHIFDRAVLDSRSVKEKFECPTSTYVSSAQTESDAWDEMMRFVDHANGNQDLYIWFPCIEFNVFRTGDYIHDGTANLITTVYDHVGKPDLARPVEIPLRIAQFLLYRHYGTNTGQDVVAWQPDNSFTFGTTTVDPTFTTKANYTTYIGTSASFTAGTYPTGNNIPRRLNREEWNLDDIHSAYIANTFNMMNLITPYGLINVVGSTGDFAGTMTIHTCSPWNRVAYLLGHTPYNFGYSETLPYGSSAFNKIYHINRLAWGLLLGSVTKWYGACENILPMITNPRSSALAGRLFDNIYSVIGFGYIGFDKITHFLYPAVTLDWGISTLNNLLYTCNGTWTAGTNFNNPANATGIPGTLTARGIDRAYAVYLNDAQWWRGDQFGDLVSPETTFVQGASNARCKVHYSKDGSTGVKFTKGIYCTQGSESVRIMVVAAVGDNNTFMSVRAYNWNLTDTVVLFMQPKLWDWPGYITGIEVGGLLSAPTTASYIPTTGYYYTIPDWAELPPQPDKMLFDGDPEKDF